MFPAEICRNSVKIRNAGKIWVHQDGTERIVVQQLLDLGIPKSDLVLA